MERERRRKRSQGVAAIGARTHAASQVSSCLSLHSTAQHSFSNSTSVQLSGLITQAAQALDPPASISHVPGLQASIPRPINNKAVFPLTPLKILLLNT